MILPINGLLASGEIDQAFLRRMQIFCLRYYHSGVDYVKMAACARRAGRKIVLVFREYVSVGDSFREDASGMEKQSENDGREDMLPELFKKRMRQVLGEEYIPFLESFGEQHCQALRLNVLKKGLDGSSAAERYGIGRASDAPEKQNAGNVDEMAVQCGERNADGADEKCRMAQESNRTDFAHLTKVPWAENGYYYQQGDQPGKHPFHEAGVYYIQEPSAMAPAELLEAKPGERVLDLCAAPGGKSTQIAAKLQGQGILVCNEIHPARAKTLSENIERMGICNACVTNETPERLADFFPGYFDKVLVDAPCSGEGMFRKNEAACDEWIPENVKLCAQRQDEIGRAHV